MIKNLLQIILAFSLLIYIIFARFRKLTLTKSLVTFDLIFITILAIIFFLLLIATCSTLFTTKKSTPYSTVVLIFYKDLINNYYYVPLKIFDDYLAKVFKRKYYLNRGFYSNKLLQFLYCKILYPTQFKITNIYFITYWAVKYIPKIIVASSFLLDIFYFKEFHYFYWSLPLLLLPLLLQYLKYYCFYQYNEYIALLEPSFEILDNIPRTPDNLIPMLSVTQYLDKIIPYHIQKKPNNPFKGKMGLSYAYFVNRSTEERELGNVDYDKLTAKYVSYLTWLERPHLIYVLLTKPEKLLDNYVNLMLFSCYFIGWTYIVIISLNDLSFLNIIQDTMEPFSQLKL